MSIIEGGTAALCHNQAYRIQRGEVVLVDVIRVQTKLRGCWYHEWDAPFEEMNVREIGAGIMSVPSARVSLQFAARRQGGAEYALLEVRAQGCAPSMIVQRSMVIHASVPMVIVPTHNRLSFPINRLVK